MSVTFAASHNTPPLYEQSTKVSPQDKVKAWNDSHQSDVYANDYITARDNILNFLNSSSETFICLSNLKLESLPDIFDSDEVKNRLEKLKLVDSTITQLPGNFNLPSLIDLDLSNSKITQLPDGFNPPKLKRIYLNNSDITHLPQNFNPPCLTFLRISQTQIDHLPNNFNPPNLKQLYASGTLITHLPQNFNPPKLLFLFLENSRLVELPSNFDPPVLTTLRLSGSQISHFSDHFNPQRLRELDLNNTPITHIPVHFNPHHLRLLNLSNTSITSLSETILSLPQGCTIHLTLPNFSNHVRENLRQRTQSPNYAGPNFVYNMGTIQPDNYLHLSLEKVFELVLKKAEKDTPEMRSILQTLTHDKTVQQKNSLKIWLARLSETASANSENSKKFFKDVVSVLKHAAESEEMNSIFHSVLETATKTCGDRVALSVLHFDIQKQLAHLDVSRPKEVYTFLVNCVYVMDFLEKRAMNLVPTLPFTDPLEVFLGLPIVLKDEFSILINLGEMLYFNCSGLNKDHIDTAKVDLRDKLKDEDKLFGFLIEQPKWTDVLKAIYPEEFKQAKENRDNDAADPVLATTALDKYNITLKSLTKKAKPIGRFSLRIRA